MRIFLRFTFVVLMMSALSACAPSNRAPKIPEGAATEKFVKKRTVFMRGVTGRYNIDPNLSNEVYYITCMSTYQGRPASARAAFVFSYINKNQPLIREQILGDNLAKSSRSKNITRPTFGSTGCKTWIEYELITKDKTKVLQFLFKNNLLGQLGK